MCCVKAGPGKCHADQQVNDQRMRQVAVQETAHREKDFPGVELFDRKIQATSDNTQFLAERRGYT